MSWSAVASDDFNRANGALGANWTKYSPATWNAFTIASNKIRPAVGANRTGMFWNALQPRSDQAVQLTLATYGSSSGDEMGAYLRSRDTGSTFDAYYGILTKSGSNYIAEIIRVAAGSLVSLVQRNTGISAFAAGDVMRFQALGQQLAILINGTPVVGITDTTWASGYAGCGGVVGIAGNMEFDDWSVLEFSAGRGF